MDIAISRSTVSGTARAPPSKSYTHRAILAAGYGDRTTVHDPLVSADTRATMRAVEAFGGRVTHGERGANLTPSGNRRRWGEKGDEREALGELHVEGFDGRPAVPADVLDCANSGTTMRLLTATAALTDGLVVVTGDESLRSRPQGPLLAAIEALGGRAESTRANGRAPLVVGGPISGGRVSIPGDVSSQYVTALLMAGALTEAGIEITLETALKSAPYVAITREVLDAFGVETTHTDEGFAVPGGQHYEPKGDRYRVPGDFSSAAYLLAAGALRAPDGLDVKEVYPSAQGDAAIIDILKRMGAAIEWNESEGVVTIREAPLSGIEVNIGDTPDLLPTVAVLGAAADGETRIENAEHVRYKETDRVAAMAAELGKLGAAVTEERDVLTVWGGDSTLRGTHVRGHGDHRIVMALAVCGLLAKGTTHVEGAEHVDVSFPGFFDVLERLEAEVERS